MNDCNQKIFLKRSRIPFGELIRCNSFPVQVENDDEIRPSETLQLDFSTIMTATNNFSDANRLGQGGFGPVYKVNITLSQKDAHHIYKMY